MGLQPYVHTNNNLNFKLLLHGQPGTGKTFFAATASKLGKTLFLNVEGGMMSAAPTPNIIVLDVFNTPQQSCIQALDQIIWALAARDMVENPWIKDLRTIVLDSGSEFAAIALEHITRNAVEKEPKRKGGSVDSSYLEDHGKSGNAIKRLFRQLRDLPYHVIITSLSRNEYPKMADGSVSSTPDETRPDFTGKVSESVMGYMDAVWHAYRIPPQESEKEGKIAFLTQPHGPVRAKTRGTNFPLKLPKVLVNPSFPDVVALLNQHEGSKSATPTK